VQGMASRRSGNETVACGNALTRLEQSVYAKGIT
jgi:hypothetical protein